jgi:hypothetical protein
MAQTDTRLWFLRGARSVLTRARRQGTTRLGFENSARERQLRRALPLHEIPPLLLRLR